MGKGYGGLQVKRVTGTTSVGEAAGVIIQNVIVTHKSNVRVVCHVKDSTTGGATNIRIPFDADFNATPVRKMTSVFLDDVGLPITGGKAYVKLSGTSTVGYIYYRNL